ncbi:hypothetical protein [Herbaspirillum lusitanum]|uniref:hypothetical protein n=1 Tax=Herbaspirillum lusitanum TaxID=213312 RepID=UPI0012F514B5|nr:hypothetical protein [Herbaspirillum lusitanum]
MFNFNAVTRPFTASLVTSALLCLSFNTHVQAADYKNTRAYKDAFTCGKESLQSDPSGNSTVSYCIGNSRDPSKVELQAFKDAVATGKNGNPKKPSK